MTPIEFEKLLAELGPARAYEELTGREDWADKLVEMIPDHMQYGVVRWVAYGLRSNPGGFLSAVLMNDLFDAFGRADVESAARLKDICSWFHNYAPAGARHYASWDGLVKDAEA